MAYDLSCLTNMGNMADMMTCINNYSSGWFGYMIVVFTFIVSLIITNRYESTDAFIVSSFGTFLISIILAWGGWVNSFVVLITILMLGVSVVFRK